mgnify:CR=1 FL=1
MNDCFKHGALRAAAAFITAGVAPAFAAQNTASPGQGMMTGMAGIFGAMAAANDDDEDDL